MEHETGGGFGPEGSTSEELEPEKAFLPEPEADKSGENLSDSESEPEPDQGGQSGAHQEVPAAAQKLYDSFTGPSQPITQSRTRSGRDAASLQAPIRAVDVNHLPPEPTTLYEAQASPEWPNWQRAWNSEMGGQLERQVWEVVPRPKGKMVLGTETIFERKIGKDGRIEKYKCRFVAQGFRQTKGIHYDESSSPTPSQASTRMVLGIAAVKDWELRQLDVDTAYLEANVKEDLYIELPEDHRNSCDQVGRLQKAMYGLVHAGLLWSKKFSTELAAKRFEHCQADPCVLRRVLHGKVISIVVYVDDPLVAKRNEAGAKPLSKDDAPQTKAETEERRAYREAVGAFMWAATMTRTDVAYGDYQLGKRPVLESSENGTTIPVAHKGRWDHVRRNAGVVHKTLGTWVDADFATCPDTRHSVSGGAVMLGGGVISWFSRVQKVAAAASSETEHEAMAEVVNELRFRRQVKGFLTPPIDDNIIMREDNEGAIKIHGNQPFQQQAYEARGRETPHRSRRGREWCGSNPLRQVGEVTCRCADERVGRQHL